MFLGRDTECGMLSALLERSRDESVGTVLVRGPGGVGKTALIDAWLAEVPPGTLILRGFSDAFDRGFPYSAIDNALTDLVRRAGVGAPAMLEPTRALIDNYRQMLRGSLEHDRADPHIATQALLEAVSAITDEPAIVVLEDAHLADPDTLSVCALLTRHTGARVLLVITARPSHSTTAQLEAYLERLSHQRRASVIDLSPLGRAESDDLLAHHLGFTPSRETARRLGEYAAGNPFFIQEIADQWHDLDGDARAAGIDEWEPSAMSRTVNRLAHTDSDEFAVGSLLSISRTIDRARLDLLPALTSLGEQQVADALAALVGQGVLVPTGTAYSFRHDLLREGFHTAIGAEPLRILRGRLAAALIERRESGAKIDIYELAELIVGSRSAPDPTTVSVFAEAASQAARSGPLVAVDWLRRAQEYAGRGEVAAGFLQQEVALLSLAGQTSTAFEIARRAIDEGDRHEAGSLVPIAVAVALGSGQAKEAVRISELLPLDRRPLMLTAARATALLMLWDAERGIPEYERAMAAYRITPDPHYSTALMLYSSARMLSRATDMTEIGKWIEESINANDNALTQLTQVAAWAAMAAHGPEGLLDRVNSDPRISGEAFSAIGWPISSESGVAEQFYLQWCYLRGRWDDVLDLVPGIDVISERGQYIAANTARVFTAGVHYNRGNLEEADKLIAPYSDEPLSMMAGYLATLRSRLLAHEGRIDDGIALLRSVLARAEETGIVVQTASVSGMLCALLREKGEYAETLELSRRSLERQRELKIPMYTGTALVAYGRAHDDMEILQEAADLFTAQGMPFPLAQTQLLLGEKDVDAKSNLRSAYQIFGELKTKAFRQRALAAMHERGVRVTRSRAGDDSLTAVEHEIVELVVAGMTNAQVAERLSYSPKTIEMHLTRIYQRTGVRNRVGLVEAVATGRLR
ncbi:AAA family ATPase [Epidermidibacterium keratini]|uniref:AAA family ATPase n=1 Tax=Epidermidibacterium keratini TaxID=1891644 RepID=A0A7L4YPM9_9ACTN|nr:LuxR family transcriptional regulator [Epidermidibacterium keratini]QHC00844.1 AAA family ATPase [Epidermidibacterium keratini]